MKFVFFGDSICFGQRVSPHLIWVSRISQDLERISEGKVVVANNSVNGNTTRNALERVGPDLQSENPIVVYIQFGLNDCNFWQTDHGHARVSLEAYKWNLVEIINRARFAGAQKVLLGTNHLTQFNGPMEKKISSKAPMPYREHIRIYNNAVRVVAEMTDVTLVDIEAEWIEGPERKGLGEAYLDPDGLHLSPLGHDFYYHIVGPACRKAVSTLLT